MPFSLPSSGNTILVSGHRTHDSKPSASEKCSARNSGAIEGRNTGTAARQGHLSTRERRGPSSSAERAKSATDTCHSMGGCRQDEIALGDWAYAAGLGNSGASYRMVSVHSETSALNIPFPGWPLPQLSGISSCSFQVGRHAHDPSAPFRCVGFRPCYPVTWRTNTPVATRRRPMKGEGESGQNAGTNGTFDYRTAFYNPCLAKLPATGANVQSVIGPAAGPPRLNRRARGSVAINGSMINTTNMLVLSAMAGSSWLLLTLPRPCLGQPATLLSSCAFRQ